MGDGIRNYNEEALRVEPPGPVKTYYLSPAELARYQNPPPVQAAPTSEEVHRMEDEKVAAIKSAAPNWPPMAEELRRLIEQGKTTRELAEIFCKHPTTIARLKAQCGIGARDLQSIPPVPQPENAKPERVPLVSDPEGVPSVPQGVPSAPQAIPPGPGPGEAAAELERGICLEGLVVLFKDTLLLVSADGRGQHAITAIHSVLSDSIGKRIMIGIRPVA